MTARCRRPSSISSAVLPKAASPASSRPRSASTRSGCRRSNTRPCTTSASWRHCKDAVHQITAGTDCRYIVQLGDTGAHTHTSLKPQDEDRISASPFFDFALRLPEQRPGNDARGRSRSPSQASRPPPGASSTPDCDGVEITASKGYLIHQFLNPFTNRRDDAYGGSIDRRFRFLEEIVCAVRQAVGPNFLFGVRLSAKDFNYLPINIRWPLFAAARLFRRQRPAGDDLLRPPAGAAWRRLSPYRQRLRFPQSQGQPG